MAEKSPRYPRDFHGHGADRPDAAWPGGARIAVSFVLNYEEGGENCLLHGDAASEAFLSEIVGAAPWPGQRHWNMESIYDYGSRAGFWRLHRLFTETRVPVTVYGVATALARNPSQVEAMQQADWEIASHGLKWIDYKDHTPEDEAADMDAAIKLHTEVTGARPMGWYTGRCSVNTVALAAQRGFDWISDTYDDDLPYWIDVDGRDQKTIAVMGCGMDIIYPAENFELFKKISETGAVISEFPFGRRADRQTFPMRNRIVSGMCQGLIVVESDIQGGSMISARFAAEQGRSVFAVPGRIDQATSRGCHQLIREGATLLAKPEDVVEELGFLLINQASNEPLADNPSSVSITDDEKAVLDQFDGGEILDMDQLINLTGKSSPELASTLMMLELKHLVTKRFDGTFEASVRF